VFPLAATVQEEGKKKAWYLKLVADLKAILIEQEKAILPFKHQMGKRILQEREKVEPEYGNILNFMKELAQELNYGWRELYFCIEFAQKYPNLEDYYEEVNKLLSPGTKAPTWKDIRSIVLPRGLENFTEEKKPKEVKRCPIEQLFIEEILPKLIVRRDQAMNCGDCPLNSECIETTHQLESFAKFIIDVIA